MQMRQTNARQALESIEEARSQVGRLRRSVKALQSKCTGSVSRPGSAIGSHHSTHPELWDLLADRKSLLQQKEQQLQQMEDQLDQWIDLLPRPRWRMVLRCHYLDGMELSDVAQELTRSTGREFTAHQIYRFHRLALEAADKLWPLS